MKGDTMKNPSELLNGKQRLDETNAHLFREAIQGIYALSDPREPDRVRYVGSSQDVLKRWRQHALGGVPQFSDGPKRAWLTALAQRGVKPVAFVLELTDAPRQSEALHAVERKWITAFRQFGGADLNVQLATNKQKITNRKIVAIPDWKHLFFEQRRENEKLREQIAQHEQHAYNMRVCCKCKPSAAYNTTQLGALAQVVCCMCGGGSMLVNPQDFA